MKLKLTMISDNKEVRVLEFDDVWQYSVSFIDPDAPFKAIEQAVVALVKEAMEKPDLKLV